MRFWSSEIGRFCALAPSSDILAICHWSCSFTSVYLDQNQCRLVTVLVAIAMGSSLMSSLRGVSVMSIDQPTSNSLRLLDELSFKRLGSQMPLCFCSSSRMNSGLKLAGSASSAQARLRSTHSGRESPSRILLSLV